MKQDPNVRLVSTDSSITESDSRDSSVARALRDDSTRVDLNQTDLIGARPVDVTSLQQVLHQYWGYTEFRPLQQEAMAAILSGRDSIVVLPTGAGKSLCFQAPALVGDGGAGVALVVSPLISLMKDQVDGLQVDGVAAAALNSSLAPERRDEVLAKLAKQQYRLLYVSPERLVGEGGERFRRVLAVSGVRFIAIDEAHCISQWGHDFRPEYRQLGTLRDAFPGASIHAFTATATVRVRQDIALQLGLRNPSVLVGSFDRPNLVYRIVRRDDLRRQIKQIIARHKGEAGIIYCITRKDVDAIAAWLLGQGYSALPYHAGLTDVQRAQHQDAFLTERADIIVATVAFGMGIDRSNVRYIIHAAAPRSLEHYQQESGRAGRDGLEAECVLIYSPEDFVRWRKIFELNGQATEPALVQLREIDRYAGRIRCRHRALVEHFGQPYDKVDCGACDWCLKELDRVDEPLVLAQKILSCIARVRQSWGISHVSDILRGRASEQVLAKRHHELSTYGLLKDCSPGEVRDYIEQLTHAGVIERTEGDYPVLRLTARGADALKGRLPKGSLVLFKQPRPVRGESRLKVSRSAGESWAGVDRGLFDALREVRRELARQRGVPPYVIFHDTSLRDLARVRPSTIEALRHVYGVGARKAEDLGAYFLDEIRRYCAAHGLDHDAMPG